MIKFRKAVSGTKVENIYQDGAIYGFNRGDSAYFLLNASDQPTSVELAVALQDGDYTDLLSGTSYTISGGKLKVDFALKGAVALVKN